MKTKISIHALLKLMSDSDVSIQLHAKKTLLGYGSSIIPDLLHLEDECIHSPELKENLEEVLQQLRFVKIKTELQNWKKSRFKDLKTAFYIINTYQFPDLERTEFDELIDKIYQRCFLKINFRQTSFEKIRTLNSVFFDEFGFKISRRLPYSPFEIYLNSVIDTREGSGFSIGLLYSIVAQSLSIPLYGVASLDSRTPFVLAYIDKENLLSALNWEINNNGVLFYVYMENKGLILEPSHLQKLYQEERISIDKTQFEPSPNTFIIKKYLNEIYKSYANHTYFRYKLKDIEELLKIFED